MKKRILTSLIIFSGLLITVSGQEAPKAEKENNYKHALGIGAGFTTGYGLSYRFLPKKIGIQTTFAPYSDEYTVQFSIGITFLYKLIESKKTNFYLYQGNHFFYDKYKDDYNYRYPTGYYNEETVNKYFNSGIGFGIEFIILNRVSFNLMGGYAAFENFERMSLTGETGLYFRF